MCVRGDNRSTRFVVPHPLLEEASKRTSVPRPRLVFPFTSLLRPLAPLAFALWSLTVCANVLEGRVVAVAYGDTITLLDGNRQQHRIRLAWIDAPEKAQPFSQRSKQHLSELAFGKDAKGRLLQGRSLRPRHLYCLREWTGRWSVAARCWPGVAVSEVRPRTTAERSYRVRGSGGQGGSGSNWVMARQEPGAAVGVASQASLGWGLTQGMREVTSLGEGGPSASSLLLGLALGLMVFAVRVIGTLTAVP
jgi:hypothetical protein